MIPFSQALLILKPQCEKSMIIHNGYENLKLVNPFVTVGVFDGVHLGHRAILNKLASSAGKAGGESVVITFDPPPRLVLSENTRGFSYLSTLDEIQDWCFQKIQGVSLIFQPWMKRRNSLQNP